MILNGRVAYRLSRGQRRLLIAISLLALATFPVLTGAEPNSPIQDSHDGVALRKQVRMLVKEPEYKSTPLYALLAFRKDMKRQSWLVVDGDIVYVDRNANGDLTDKEDRVALDVEESARRTQSLANPGQYVGSNVFDFGKVAGHNFTFDVWVLDEDFVPPSDYPEVLGRYRKERIANGWANASLYRRDPLTTEQIPVCLCPRPKDAQITYIDGPRTFNLRIARGEDRQFLERDTENLVGVRIGTRGVATTNNRQSVFASMMPGKVPDNAYPIAVFEFPSRIPMERSIKQTVVLGLKNRGLHRLFARVKVPFGAASGNVKITVSFPAWPEGNVALRVFEIPLK